VVRAIHLNTNAIIPLSSGTPQHPRLTDDDVVEVPCAVGANGAQRCTSATCRIVCGRF